jgi:alkaline phosphatase D
MEAIGPMIPFNPQIKFFQDRRGYQRAVLTPHLFTTELRMVSTVRSEEATVETVATYVVENGKPGPVEG